MGVRRLVYTDMRQPYIQCHCTCQSPMHLQIDSDRSVEEVYADVGKLFRELTDRK